MRRYLPAIATFFLMAQLSGTAVASDYEEADLVGMMSQLQLYLHKLDLSVQAGNERLAGFYLHELEEIGKKISAEVASYDGFPVGELTRSMLLTQLEELENGASDLADGVTMLIDTCNACHEATDHGYIKITSASVNPFNQDFDPD